MPGERIPAKHLHFMAGGGSPYGNNALGIVTVDCQNNSGGAVARGDVVVTDWANCTKDLFKFKTSAGGADTAVLGVVFDQSIASGAIGKVQIFGPHDAVNVDGTTAIAVGDRLKTFTTVKQAQKAASATGQPGVFATALSADAVAGAGTVAAFITRLDFARQE